MKTCLISGWAQPVDLLAQALPGSGIDYMHYATPADYFAALKPFAGEVETLVGWSLGGQLAMRAVAEGVLKPRRLVLIATPYQFVSSDGFPFGMPRESFDEFRASFVANPGKTLSRFGILMAKGDQNAKDMIETLIAQPYAEKPHGVAWLDTLGGFSCRGMNTSAFPPTAVVQGEGDVVVPAAQAAALAAILPKAQVHLWKFCGHVPSLHDAAALKALVDAMP